MPLINLDIAAYEIKQACENSPARLPFFFLVGAGISSPPIPLASEIVEQCKARAEGRPGVDEAASPLPIEAYSYWFQRAYAQRKDRQWFLRRLMNGQPISHANFRLAHLLLNKSVSNLVVTTNFDDFLSRALTLFGKQHIVCDHPSLVERIVPEESDDIQIMHVHGTYWFYDCCNLNDEINRRAKLDPQSDSTMVARLKHILSQRVPLVIGYSGWEGDVVMTALERRIKGQPLPHNLYWFCYRQASIESLPDWLKNHPDVYFVVPQPSGHEPIFDVAGEGTLVQSQAELLSHAPATGVSEKQSDEPVLPAHKVLDKLIRTFKLEAPELTTDPLKFFASHLRNSLPLDDSGRVAADGYLIGSVIERIELAQEWDQKQAAMRRVENQLEKVRDALRRCQYQEAIQQGCKINKTNLAPTQLEELLSAMVSSASNLNDNSEDELVGYQIVVEIGDMLEKQGKTYSALEVAKALINKGVTLSRRDQNKEALDVYDDLIDRFGETEDSCLRVEVARALINKGAVLYALERKAEAIAAYEKVLEKFNNATETPLHEQLARALVNKGVTHSRLNQNKEALAAYDALLDRFGESAEPTLDEEIAGALINKGVTLRALNRKMDAINVYEDVLRRFSDNDKPALREEVARALINKGVTFSRLGGNNGANIQYSAEAIAAYEDVVKRFADATEPNLLKQVARAWVNLGVTYSMLGKRSEAIAAYQQVLDRFDESSDPILQEQVANALNGIGFQMICEAKQRWKENQAFARNTLLGARKRIDVALKIVPEEPVFLGNQGYIEFLLGNKDKALELLTQAIKLGGDKIRKVELDDSEINQLEDDKEFRELILSIPAFETTGAVRGTSSSYTFSKHMTGEIRRVRKLP